MSIIEAGVARVNITPTHPIWLEGFAERNRISEEIYHELYIKALAIADGAPAPKESVLYHRV
jgi:hypothetical protein